MRKVRPYQCCWLCCIQQIYIMHIIANMYLLYIADMYTNTHGGGNCAWSFLTKFELMLYGKMFKASCYLKTLSRFETKILNGYKSDHIISTFDLNSMIYSPPPFFNSLFLHVFDVCEESLNDYKLLKLHFSLSKFLI